MQLSTTQIAVIAVVCVVAVGGGAFFVLNSGGEDNNFEINDIPNLSKVYDGKAVSYAPSLSEGSADLSVTWFSGDVELTSAPVNAGHYKIVVKGENGKITKTKEAEFDIAKAQFELTVDNASAYNKIYDTLSVPMPVITTDSTNEPTISWHDSEGYFISDPPSDVGSYKLVVSIGGNENYEGKDVRLEFTISPVPAGDDQVTYSYANIIMSGMYASALNGGWRIGGIDLDGNGIDYSITYHRYNNDLGTRLGASNLLPAYILSSTDYGYFVKLTLDNNPNFATQEYYCDIDVHSTSKALDTQVSFTNTAYLYTDDSQFVLLKKPTTSMFESLKVYGSDGWPLEPLMEDFISGFNLYFAEDSKVFIIFNPGRSIALSGYIIRNTDNVHNAPADPENQTSFSILFQANSSSSRHILTFQMKTADEYYVTPDEGITAQEMYLDTNGEWQEGEIATNDDPYHDMDYDGGIRYFIIEVSASNNTLELVVVEDMM